MDIPGIIRSSGICPALGLKITNQTLNVYAINLIIPSYYIKKKSYLTLINTIVLINATCT